VVTKPLRVSEHAAHAFAKERAQWIAQHVRATRGKVLLPRRTRRTYAADREVARKLTAERLAFFNKHYGYRIGRVSIRNQKSRWGSCSRHANLNFSYRLIDLPAHLADYIVVHELCHIGELNHSPAFWAL